MNAFSVRTQMAAVGNVDTTVAKVFLFKFFPQKNLRPFNDNYLFKLKYWPESGQQNYQISIFKPDWTSGC
ncbi:unnamed protein product [Meloidogyne enterolobii]|uniref:Uncharacterized protein n=1 Tax=Meloidogyne enterolobii TaxID=390850 RepID=A0ACB0YR77_MELEN